MASYTPNLNLYKPDSTDDFSDFRSEFNNNMDILDQGGGGSGDVMDVEVNGISVVDAGTKIAEITSYEEITLAEYESIPVAERESNGIAYFIKDLNNSNVQGYPPLIYSTEEREVGVWIDGKPLYQKTYHFDSLVTLNSNTWADTGFKISDSVIVGNSVAFRDDNVAGQSFPVIVSADIGTNQAIELLQTRNSSITISGFTIQYTKTTDTAGSGTWNGQGGIAHHYSTNETVIGTWIDGKPLYEKTVVFDTGNVASNIDFNISAYMPVNSVVRESSFTLDFNFGGDTYHGANWGGAYLEINGVSYLSFNIGSAVYNKHVELTIQYTKTTD